jgi:hypothetical protein
MSEKHLTCRLIEVYGEGVMKERNVGKWCRFLVMGRTDESSEAQCSYS